MSRTTVDPGGKNGFLCLRVDLDYVPWDTPDADRFGHGEPAMLLRLLDLARRTGGRWHFFASERALRAFPTEADAVLNDGHDLDYLAKHPDDLARSEEANRLLAAAGHVARGWAIRHAWPVGQPLPNGVDFFSGPPESDPPARLFPVAERTLHETIRHGGTLRAWLDDAGRLIEHGGGTVVVSPQVLARVDPRLVGLEEILAGARIHGVPLRTLREATKN